MTNQYITHGYPEKPAGNFEEGKYRCNCPGCNKLNAFNWLETLPDENAADYPVEVRFKNTRKGYFINTTGLPLVTGDVVAVESSPGHDLGIVSLTGRLVTTQIKRYGISNVGLKKIYRKAKAHDIEKWFQAIEQEQEIMHEARRIVTSLNIEMKISDVEFQGDKTKITVYYTSDARVDFRELLKEFADRFHVRVEMKQIGSRQEAGRVGGIGTCGRELCCASWASTFASVSTGAARYQDMVLNPHKLTGQCGKLKCCLNYELKTYMDAQADFPNPSTVLETEQGKAYHYKTDVFRRMMWYTFERNSENAPLIPLDVDTVKEIIRLNRQGIIIKTLESSSAMPINTSVINYQNAVGEDSISRFEEKRRKKKRKQGRNDRNVRETKGQSNTKSRETRSNQTQTPVSEPRNDREPSVRSSRKRGRGGRTKGTRNEPKNE